MDLLEKLKTNFDKFVETQNLGDLFSDKELADEGAVKNPIVLNPNYSFEHNIGNGAVRFSAGAKFSIQLFNNLEVDADKDDGLLQNEPEKSFISFNKENPVLKYKLNFQVSPSFRGKFDLLSFGIDSNVSLAIASYLLHSKNETVGNAIENDMENIPLVFNLDDIKSIKINECLAYNCSGELVMQSSFSITEILLACIPALKSTFEIASSTMVDIEIGDKVELMFSIKDSFKFAVSKVAHENYKISIKKSKSNNRNLGAGLGIKFGIKKIDAIAAYLSEFADSFLEGIAGVTIAELNEELDKIKTNLETAVKSLDDKDSTISKILVRFNIDAADKAKKLNKLVKKVEVIRKTIANITELLENTQITASVKYEYERISSNDEILSALIPQTELEKHFENLIKLDTVSLLNDASFRSCISEYLRTKTIDETRKWGLSIGIGNLNMKTTNEDDKTLDRKLEVKYDDEKIDRVRVKLLYDGFRRHEKKKFSEDEVEWWVGFMAEMPSFSDNTYPDIDYQGNNLPEVRFDEFDYSFSFLQKHTEKVFKDKRREYRKFLEFMNIALIWDIIPSNEFKAQCNAIWKVINDENESSDAEISLHLQLPKLTANMANRIYGVLQNKDACNINFSRAFARMMPYVEGFEYRTNIEKRTEFYSKYWLNYFTTDSRGDIDMEAYSGELSKIIAADLEKLNEKELAIFESDVNEGKSFHNAFLPITWRLRNLKKQAESFAHGLKELLFHFLNKSNKGSHKIIEKSYGLMKEMWRNDQLAIALGAFFIEITRDAPAFRQEIKRGIEIEYKNKDGKKRKIDLS